MSEMVEHVGYDERQLAVRYERPTKGDRPYREHTAAPSSYAGATVTGSVNSHRVP